MRTRVRLLAILTILHIASTASAGERCYGLYLGDSPSIKDIKNASSLYSAAPCMTLIFYDATWVPSATLLEDISDSGAIPVITIEPWNSKTKEPAMLTAEYAKELAKALNAHAKEAYIRFAHEMNGNWYPWAGSPEAYIEGYRTFHDMLSKELTNKNVKWIFSVNNENVPRDNRAISYYPGDGYVDVIGIDGYLKEPSWWKKLFIRLKGTFTFMFGEQVADLSVLGKPIYITETGVASDDDFKAYAISSMFSDMEKEYPSITRLIWFDVKKEADWRIASGIKSLEFFKDSIRKWLRP